MYPLLTSDGFVWQRPCTFCDRLVPNDCKVLSLVLFALANNSDWLVPFLRRRGNHVLYVLKSFA